jgi:hypothetical protein
VLKKVLEEEKGGNAIQKPQIWTVRLSEIRTVWIQGPRVPSEGWRIPSEGIQLHSGVPKKVPLEPLSTGFRQGGLARLGDTLFTSGKATNTRIPPGGRNPTLKDSAPISTPLEVIEEIKKGRKLPPKDMGCAELSKSPAGRQLLCRRVWTRNA